MCVMWCVIKWRKKAGPRSLLTANGYIDDNIHAKSSMQNITISVSENKQMMFHVFTNNRPKVQNILQVTWKFYMKEPYVN